MTYHSTDPSYRLTPAGGGRKITVKAFYNKANYLRAVSPASAAVSWPCYFTLGAASIIGTAAVGYTVEAGTAGVSPAMAPAIRPSTRNARNPMTLRFHSDH
ncbi:hypothetical protein [Arthrobacter sp. D1-17]